MTDTGVFPPCCFCPLSLSFGGYKGVYPLIVDRVFRNDGHTEGLLLFCHSRNLAGNPNVFTAFFSHLSREGVPGFPAKRLFGRVGKGGDFFSKEIFRVYKGALPPYTEEDALSSSVSFSPFVFIFCFFCF